MIKLVALSTLLVVALGACGDFRQPWRLKSAADWREASDFAQGVAVGEGGLVLEGASEGTWTSGWHDWSGLIESARVTTTARLDLFGAKTIEVLVDGSEKPFTDAKGIPHDWYGRCMIAILDENRWVMAVRSGVDHMSWDDWDAIHILTSSDEGRSWGGLNRWFDGTPIDGMPYDDGYTHSEPGLYRMPNGDLILQFWRTGYSTGTKQLRSQDQGKTWDLDLDRISVEGVDGADDDRAIGTEDYFVDPENPTHVYMAFQYFHYDAQAGTLLARSTDNGKSYRFLSWIGPLSDEEQPESGATFEPAIEYVGNRTIVAILRDGAGTRHTWQTISTDMGASFAPLEEISDKINGGISNGLWQRARLYKESNPYFQYDNPMDYSKGEGRLWGFGIHSMGGGYTRKPVVYWSDDNGSSWQGPELLHGPMHPGTDTGYGDMKRRVDNTFVAATYYADRESDVADLEQYTFGGARGRLLLESDSDGDGNPEAESRWYELLDGDNAFSVSSLPGSRWRVTLRLSGSNTDQKTAISHIEIAPGEAGDTK